MYWDLCPSTNPTPNTGVVNPLQPQILQVPRHPVNLYFNVTTPAQWLAEDNCLYPPGAFGHVDTYDQLLERESSVLLTYMARGDIDPLMFHQPSMTSYSGAHSLLSDLIDRTLAKYNAAFTLPALTLTQDQIGTRIATGRRTTHPASRPASCPACRARGPQSITITAQQAATIPVTGLRTAPQPGAGHRLGHARAEPADAPLRRRGVPRPVSPPAGRPGPQRAEGAQGAQGAGGMRIAPGQARARVEAHLGRPPHDALEAAVVLEAWGGLRARSTLELGKAVVQLSARDGGSPGGPAAPPVAPVALSRGRGVVLALALPRYEDPHRSPVVASL